MRIPRPRLADATVPLRGLMITLMVLKTRNNIKIASEMPVPHSLGKYFQHHEI